MARRRRYADEEEQPLPPDRSFVTRLAWGVLLVVGVGVALRATVATVVTVHGDGMAPTIQDGDLVMLVRGSAHVDRGDVVVYEPIPNVKALAQRDQPIRIPRGMDTTHARYSGVQRQLAPPLPDTAVVDREEIEKNWQKIQRDTAEGKSDAPALRVGRVLAVPGDTVAFNVPGAALGLAVNGHPMRQKSSAPERMPLTAVGPHDEEPGLPSPGEKSGTESGGNLGSADGSGALAFEWIDDVRYPVIPQQGAPEWSGMGLPADGTPVQIEADAFLVLADNRSEGACCDSRALGWIPAELIRGELFARLTSEGGQDGEGPPRARGMQWLP